MKHQWPPEVTRAMHQFYDAAPAAPSLTSVDELRPIPPLRPPRGAQLESEQHLIPVEENSMAVDSPPTSEVRNRRRLAMAAAAVVAVLGVAAIAFNIRNSDDDEELAPATQPTIAPTTTAAPRAPRTQIGSFSAVADVPAVSFIVPDGWTADTAGVYKAAAERDGSHLGVGSVGVIFSEVTNIYTDPCQWVLLDPPVGPTVDDLISAWATVPGFNATDAVDVTLDGYVGKQIEFTVPDYKNGDCKQNRYGFWQDDGPPDTRTRSQPNWWAQGPNQHNRLWILDVGGTRVVITVYSFAGISPEDQAALDQVLASIQIG